MQPLAKPLSTAPTSTGELYHGASKGRAVALHRVERQPETRSEPIVKRVNWFISDRGGAIANTTQQSDHQQFQ